MSGEVLVVTCRATGRVGALTAYATEQLGGGDAVRVVDLSRLDLNALAIESSGCSTGCADLRVRSALTSLERARFVVLVTPVHQGSYAGVLKLYLDAVRRDGLRGKTVVVLGCAGTVRHALALAPILGVLSAMGADSMPQPCCLGPDDWSVHPAGPQLLPSAARRLDQRLRHGFDRSSTVQTHDMTEEALP